MGGMGRKPWGQEGNKVGKEGISRRRKERKHVLGQKKTGINKSRGASMRGEKGVTGRKKGGQLVFGGREKRQGQRGGDITRKKKEITGGQPEGKRLNE